MARVHGRYGAFLAWSIRGAALVCAALATCVTPATAGINYTRWMGLDLIQGQASIMNAQVQQRVISGLFDGTFTPKATYDVSPAVDEQFETAFAQYLVQEGFDGGEPAARSYVAARKAAYAHASAAVGSNPNNYVTACTYFAVTALESEFGRTLTADESGAMRGVCVIKLGVSEPTKPLDDKALQIDTDAFGTLGEMLHEHVVSAKTAAERAQFKAAYENYFKQFFEADLVGFPIDHVACAAAKDEKTQARCMTVPNAKIASAAERFK